MVSKARAHLYCIQHLHLSAYLFGLMYQVFIIPLFDYCDAVWTPCLAKQVRAMERIYTLKLLLLCSSYETGYPVFYSLVEHCKFHTLMQIFRILHKMTPSYLQGLFKYSIDVTGHPGCNSNCLRVPQAQTNYGRQSLYLRGIILWNNLSPL